MKQQGVDAETVTAVGVNIDQPAGEVLIQLVEDGYQVIGV